MDGWAHVEEGCKVGLAQVAALQQKYPGMFELELGAEPPVNTVLTMGRIDGKKDRGWEFCCGPSLAVAFGYRRGRGTTLDRNFKSFSEFSLFCVSALRILGVWRGI